MLKVGDKVKIKSAENSGYMLSETMNQRRDYFCQTTFITGRLASEFTLNISGWDMMWSYIRFDKIKD